MRHQLKAFVLAALRQLTGWGEPARQGKLRLTHYSFHRMTDYQLTPEDLTDVFRFGQQVKTNMIIREYPGYRIGLTYEYDPAKDEYVIITCWKRLW